MLLANDRYYVVHMQVLHKSVMMRTIATCSSSDNMGQQSNDNYAIISSILTPPVLWPHHLSVSEVCHVEDVGDMDLLKASL